MEIELQNKNNINLSLTSNEVEIDVSADPKEIELEEREFDIELATNNVEIELGASSILVPMVSDHSILNNLEFETSGHTGFQKQMDSLTNIEIERMWNSI